MGERTANDFEGLIEAANKVLDFWLNDEAPSKDAMVGLHCAARRLDGYSTPTQSKEGQTNG